MYKIIQGDCLDVMKTMEKNSIDFVVCDPPYGLNFMGKKWDKEIPNQDIWAEALRVCKPGSMLAAFGGSRTHHHLMMALERAGWEIRDVIMWLYGSGFPKSHNHFGFEVYGTALKPAYEPIIIAMKPLDGTFAHNAEKWGVAGINIDESRIKFTSESEKKKHSLEWDRNWTTSPIHKFDKEIGNHPGEKREMGTGPKPQQGRWPANIILDEEAAEQLDQMTGILKSGTRKPNKRLTTNTFKGLGDTNNFFEGDSGGASRFFYCAKASSSERNKGLEGMAFVEKSNGNKWTDQDYRVTKGERPLSAQSGPRQNFHPTVKPIALMKYIIKLLAPPGNPICLDPFAGSGSTLLAAKELGINCIGIEKEEEYCRIAEKRLESAELDLFNYKNAR